MLHVDGSHAGPEGGGQKGRRPAKHQVQPVVVSRVVQENIDHKNVVKVQALNKRKSLCTLSKLKLLTLSFIKIYYLCSSQFGNLIKISFSTDCKLFKTITEKFCRGQQRKETDLFFEIFLLKTVCVSVCIVYVFTSRNIQ